MVRRGDAAALVLAALGLALPACRDNRVPGGDDETEGGTEDGSATMTETSPGSTTGETDSDTEGETEGSSDTDDDPQDVHPSPGGVRRLLAHQYVDSVAYLLGDAAAASADPPNDPSVGYFDAMATLSSVPAPADVELYEGSSTEIADAAVGDLGRLATFAPCVESSTNNDCYVEVAEDFGRVAWRRPLAQAEVDRLVAIARDAREWDEGVFTTGLQYMITAILQSPYFLYIVEVGGDPDDNGVRELDGYELVTRASFFLTGRTPTVERLDEAEAGAFDSDEGVRALAADLAQGNRARATVGRFFGEYLKVRGVTSKGKDPELFPWFGDELKDAMLEETLLLVEDIVFERGAPVTELFTADYTFVNDELAALYGLPAPGGWDMVDFPAGQDRSGVLTQAGWLTMMSHTNVNSPTRRGLWVQEQLLCEEVPLPPPRVNPEPVVPEEGVTLREALQQHVADPSCAACHALIDPIGFAFEHFDPTGQYRTLDNDLPIDASGSVGGIGDFDGAAEMMALVAADERLPRCLVDQVYTQGLGWVPEEQAPALDDVGLAYSDAGAQYTQLLVELVASPVFRRVDEPK